MDLSIVVNGITFPNPFLLGSGPPGTNARVIAKSYDAGWGGAVAKTISLESAKVVNVVPRYGKLRSKTSGEVLGFENIELISDRPIDVWLEEFRQIKKDYPKLWQERIMCSTAERSALDEIKRWGFTDTFRVQHEEGGQFSWWDYRAGAFRRNMGLRIDHMWVTKELVPRSTNTWIDIEPRTWERPSDHAPVVAEFD